MGVVGGAGGRRYKWLVHYWQVFSKKLWNLGNLFHNGVALIPYENSSDAFWSIILIQHKSLPCESFFTSVYFFLSISSSTVNTVCIYHYDIASALMRHFGCAILALFYLFIYLFFFFSWFDSLIMSTAVAVLFAIQTLANSRFFVNTKNMLFLASKTSQSSATFRHELYRFFMLHSTNN